MRPKKKSSKVAIKKVKILVVYAQLISQLLIKVEHAKHDEGHKALHHESYAKQVLEAGGKEL